MPSSGQTIPRYRISVYAHKPTGFAHSTAFGDVLQNGDGFFLIKLHPKQWCALSFGESLLTCPAIEQSNMPIFAEPTADSQIFCTTFAIIGTLFILATKF
jgi:hypothetical protein